MNFKPGDQIAYIPSHTNGDIRHVSVEFGFVMHVYGANGIYCRYWRKDEPGKLRTVSCSERTSPEDLRFHKSVPQQIVKQTMKWIIDNNEQADILY